MLSEIPSDQERWKGMDRKEGGGGGRKGAEAPLIVMRGAKLPPEKGLRFFFAVTIVNCSQWTDSRFARPLTNLYHS